MANTIKVKRGTDANRAGVTPAEGELLYTTDTKKVYVGDGSTAGGNEVGGGGGSSQTPAELLADIKTVDGTGSGLDADLLDGQHASAFATAAQGTLADSALQSGDNISELTNDSGFISGNQTITLSGDVSGSGTTSIAVTVADDSHNHIISNVDGLQTALDGKVDDSQVLTNVPSGAVFTDTTYSVGNGGLTEINFTSALNSKLAGIEAGATANQTASEILTAVKTVDGSGSGLDADLLDGIQGSQFLRSDASDTATGQYSFTKVTDHAIRVGTIRGTAVGSQTGEYIQLYNRVNIGSPAGWGSRGAPTYGLSTYGGADLATDTGSVTISGNTAWHAGNDGSGSGLDADLLDGVHASGFVTQLGDTTSPNYLDSSSRRVDPNASNPTNEHYAVSTFGNEGNVSGQLATHFVNGQAYTRGHNNSWSAWRKQWDSLNDGSGSGLDADLLDGWDSGHYTAANSGTVQGDWNTIFNTANGYTTGIYQVTAISSGAHSNYPSGVYPYGGVFAWRLANSTFKLYASHTGDVAYQTGWSNDGYSGWRNVLTGNNIGSYAWTSSNDGSGSGLDADLLDGQQGSYYNWRVWNSHITWNSGINIGVSGESSFDMTSGSTWQVWTAANSLPHIKCTYSGQTQIGQAGNRGLYVYGAITATGNVTAYSDMRLKDNIQPIKSALEKTNAISGNTYQRKDLPDKNPDRRYAGVLAQEVEQVLPEAVSQSEDGIKTVDYNAVIALLVESVKELKSEVDDLKQQLEQN